MLFRHLKGAGQPHIPFPEALVRMNMKLSKEMETLFIPLYGKASLSKQGLFKDPYAEAVVSQLDYDWSSLKIPRKTQVMLALRAFLMDEYTKDYIASRERSLILHLGCGLEGRFWRMNPKPAQWFDLDYPEVIDIKKRLLHQLQGLEYIPSSVLDYKWLEYLQATKEEVLVIAEGLFMYFSEEEIRSLFKALCQKFNKVTFLFDVYSKITARIASRHPSLKETGAVIQWGLDDPLEMEAYVEGLKYLKTIYFTDRRAIEGLPLKFRCQFKVAGRFKTIREAHRIWVLSFNNQSSGS